jgi:hypothetical protein
MYIKITLLSLLTILFFSLQTYAQINTSTRTSTTVSQVGITLGKDIELREGQTYKLKNNTGIDFETKIKVLELDPMGNVPKYYFTALVGIGSLESYKLRIGGSMELTGKFKYFKNPKLRFDSFVSYNFISGNSYNATNTGSSNQLRTNVGIQFVPFRFSSYHFGFFRPKIYFSKTTTYDPVTKNNVSVDLASKHKFVREIGFRAGVLYNSLNYVYQNRDINPDVNYTIQQNTAGAYAGISYGTVRNLVIGSDKLGIYKHSKYNELYFDFLYAPTSYVATVSQGGTADATPSLSNIGYRFVLNFIRTSFQNHISLQSSFEFGRYPGVENNGYVGLNIGIAYSPRKKYNVDEISSELGGIAGTVVTDGTGDIDSILSLKKKPYDYVTKNKKGYYILEEYDKLYARKPMKMVTTSREFIVTTTNTTSSTRTGRTISSNSTSRKVTYNYYYGAFDGTQQSVRFCDFSSPRDYRKDVLSQYLKESPLADAYYINTITRNRRIRRTFTGLLIAGIATSLVAYLQNEQQVSNVAAASTLGVWLIGVFAIPSMDVDNYNKALSLYNKDIKKPKK